MYDKCNIQKRYYKIRTFKGQIEELGEIVISEEYTISLYPRFYTPINSSSTCNNTPPTINKAHNTIGIADIPNILVIADSPIQPNTPSTIIMVGGVLARIVAISCIFHVHLHRQINESATVLGYLLYPNRVFQNKSYEDRLSNSEKLVVNYLFYYPSNSVFFSCFTFEYITEDSSHFLQTTLSLPHRSNMMTKYSIDEPSNSCEYLIIVILKSFINISIYVYKIIYKIFNLTYKKWRAISLTSNYVNILYFIGIALLPFHIINYLKKLVTSVLAYYFKQRNLLSFATFDDLTFNCVSPTHFGLFIGGGFN
jgi:hypothetical protein